MRLFEIPKIFDDLFFIIIYAIYKKFQLLFFLFFDGDSTMRIYIIPKAK